jgi:tetratricopeptide (TPR) repeat protein
MKTKSYSAILAVFIFASLLVSSCAPKVENKEMPITTSSKEALTAFIDGRNQAELNQSLKAIEAFKKAISLDPEFALAYAYLGITDASVYTENYTKAMNLMNNISKGEQVFIQMWENQRKRDGQEMMKNADTLLKLFPEDKRIPFFLGGSIYYSDNEKAIFYLNKSIKMDTTFAAPYRVLGLKYRAMRNFAEAEKYLLKYAELLPNEPDPYYQLSVFYRDEGKFEKAIEMASKISIVDPGNSSGYIMLGNCYIFTGEFEKARAHYMKRYEQVDDPTRKLGTLYNYSLSYVFEGKMDEALKSFDNYIDLALNNNRFISVINTCRDQAWISIISNDFIKAKKYLEKAEELIKTSDINEVSRKNLEEANMGWRAFLFISSGDYIAAEKELNAYKEVVTRSQMPNEDVQYGGMVGFLRFKQGKYDEAIDLLSKAGNYPFYWYYIGASYDAKNNQQLAKENYEKVTSYYLVNLNLASVRDLAIKKLSINQ